ncbi:MAG: nitrate reductase molybdenum cofactor assembly chaperone [Planctomycetaceae bacterium]|nr:nitrate reductase molybdenum cofactor assembly chaperone [Planctomycetaceae bacterium]
MSHIPKVLDALARVLSYPDQHTSQAAELLFIVLQGEIQEAANDMSKFGEFLEQSEPWQVEEAFTSTFDVNPTCALEVGWHLFGEEYARGMFLVRMREEMRKFGIPEDSELPDHLSHVLSVVAAMTKAEAEQFVTACVHPAVAKMNAALEEKDTPYRFAISCLARVIEQKWGECKSDDPDEEVLASNSPAVDPLHAFPVADVGCGGGCEGSCSEPNIVPLEIDITLDRKTSANGVNVRD